MNAQITYRGYIPGDEEGITDLLTLVFPNWRGINSLDVWKWKYLKTPLGSSVYVSLDRDKIVGVIEDMNLRIKIGGSVIIGQYGNDYCVHPDYRGLGIYSRLFDLKEKDSKADFAYYATENQIVSKSGMRRGYRRFPYRFADMIKIKDVKQYLIAHKKYNKIINILGFKIMKAANNLRIIAPSKRSRTSDFSIERVDRFDDRVNTFWGEVENSYKYILEKGSYYLNWRYCAPENKDLIVKLAIEDDAILGYIVMRLRTDDTEVVGSVIDFISLFDRDDVADAMIKDALVFFEDSGANSVYCPVTRGHRHQGILRNNGFINGSMARSNYLYYKFLSDKIQGNVFKDMKPDEVKLNYY